MSFLRKRSRSQSSGSSHGDDDCRSLRSGRKDLSEQSLVERRHSGISEISTRPDDYGLNDSCVLRNFPKHKSSHLRFLAWVAYTRKYDDHSITDDERRTCPLLWCREMFSDQEAMLKHVWECQYLSKGLYWCFHCQRPERVGKFQCKRCQGLPSKTDRLATVAKKIFSKLGTKRRREEYMVSSSEIRGMTSTALSNIPEATESDQCPESHDDFEPEEFPPYEALPELHNTCISEMENTSVMPEMDTSWDISRQEQRKPELHKAQSTEFSAGLYSSMVMSSADHAFSESNPPWSPSSFESQVPSQRFSGRSVPALALNTRDIYQPPSSRHRHGHFGTYPDEPMSATLISPLSATEGFFSGLLGMSAYEVSPTDTEATCNSFLTSDSGYASTTIDSATTISVDLNSKGASQNTLKKTLLNGFPTDFKQESTRDGLTKSCSHIVSASSSNVPSRSSSNGSNHSANRCTAIVKRKELSVHWTDSRSLVESFVEVLNEHLEHSRNALKQLPSNSTIKELLAMSSASIISIGFNTLRGVLEKRDPTAIIETFAFSHVAYAAAITIDEKSSKIQSEKWFQDSLCWLSGLSSERQRMSFTMIVQAIWKPQDLTEMGDFLDFSKLTELTRPSSENENRLVKACRHFLDIQENLRIHERSSSSVIPEARSFNVTQASFYRTAKSRIIDELIQKISIEAFIEDVVSVEKRLKNGDVKDLRQLELELICAGKLASQSDSMYERFLSHVTCLCDALYSEGESEKSRTEYQIEDIDVTKSLIPEEGPSDEHTSGNFDLSDLLDEQNSSLDFGSSDTSLGAFIIEANSVLIGSTYTGSNSDQYLAQSGNLARSHSNPTPPTKIFQQSRLPISSSSTIPTKSPFPPPHASKPTPSYTSANTSDSCRSTTVVPSSSPSVDDKYKCKCGYVPRGEEKWKPSNLARHKRTQHPVEAKIYRCQFPDCASTFTRSDNLRSHARDKGHDLKGAGKDWIRSDEKRERRDGEEDDGFRKKPSKRQKRIGDGNELQGAGEAEKTSKEVTCELDFDEDRPYP